MNAYWLTYSPKKHRNGPGLGWTEEEMTDLVTRFRADPAAVTDWWRIHSSKKAKVGDRVYLFKQGAGSRGIFGVGRIIDGPENRAAETDPKVRPRAEVWFEALVDPAKEDFLLGLDDIIDIAPKTLINAPASGNGVPEDFAAQLEGRLAQSLPNPAQKAVDDSPFDPGSAGDERQRALRAINVRRGQPAFRKALLKAYEKACAITGETVEDVLEAAHITPYRGSHTNHISNGLLMRADIHTLFDCGLLAIHPDSRKIVIAEGLQQSSYAALADRPVRPPVNKAANPCRKSLQIQFASFEAGRAQK
jgi:hypothetical protein